MVYSQIITPWPSQLRHAVTEADLKPNEILNKLKRNIYSNFFLNFFIKIFENLN